MRFGEPWIIERERYKHPLGKTWQTWFAWYPVRLEDGTWVWREEVEWRLWNGMTYNLPEYRKKLP